MSNPYNPSSSENPDGSRHNVSSDATHPDQAQHQQGAPQYQQGAPQYQQHPPQYQQQTKEGKNVLGIIALIVAALGLVLSLTKGALMLGWILLPIGFILGIISLFKKNAKKTTGVIAVVVSIIGTVIAPIYFFVILADSVDEAFSDETTVSDSAEGGESDEAGDGAEGSDRNNPLPLGSTVSAGDWEYTVNSVDLNATEAVMAENEFNDAPTEGQTYIMANVTATYVGSDASGDMFMGDIVFVTGQGNTISEGDAAAVAPDAFDSFETLYEGASTGGNVAFLVPEDSVEGGVMAVRPTMFADKKFVAIQ